MNEMQRGYCECGCGEKTTVSRCSRPEIGVYIGKPRRFIHGHHARRQQRKLGFPPGTLVSPEDEYLALERTWQLDKAGYVFSKNTENGKVLNIKLHRVIMGVTDPSIPVDHINGIKNDNRRENLRIVSISENGQNRIRLQGNNTSGANGVHFNKTYGKWGASASNKGKTVNLGHYSTFEEAARVAREYREKHYVGYVSDNGLYGDRNGEAAGRPVGAE